MPAGARRRSTANCRSSALCCPSEPSHAIYRELVLGATQPRNGFAFLHNHCEAIAAFDFFTVPTATFRVLYCFFVIEYERRRILHCNVTQHPSADWVVQQLREALPEAGPHRYALLDHDSISNGDVIAFLEATGLKAKRTSIRAPWQNGTAERWIGSCRREILDHIIPVNEEHLRRVIREYVRYYHDDRVHDSLRSEEHTSELQSHVNLVCRLLLEKKKKKKRS